MLLKDCNTVFGFDISYLLNYSKQFRIKSLIIYAIDLVFLALLTFFMWLYRSSMGTFFFLTFSFVVLFAISFSLFFNMNAWQTYKFFRRNKNHEVKYLDVSVSKEACDNILFCLKTAKSSQHSDLASYVQSMLNICSTDAYKAYKLFGFLKKYESDTDTTLKVSYITVNGSLFTKEKKKSYVFAMEVVNEVTEDDKKEEDTVSDVTDSPVSNTNTDSECIS